jgi:hypothetical protein
MVLTVNKCTNISKYNKNKTVRTAQKTASIHYKDQAFLCFYGNNLFIV